MADKGPRKENVVAANFKVLDIVKVVGLRALPLLSLALMYS